MNLSRVDITELKRLQPELIVIDNKISGCFYLSATLGKKSKNRGNKLDCYAWNYESSDGKHIHDCFYIEIILDDNLYPIKTVEILNKLISWKNKIPEEYWHVNPDNSLCLGERPDILKMQKQYSFANFINILLMQYLYCMSYIKLYQKEPWKSYRHGLFAMLEISYNSKNINGDSELLNKYRQSCEKEWGELSNKTKKNKIENKNKCPFCRTDKLVKNCQTHKKQIKGYNKLVLFSRQ